MKKIILIAAIFTSLIACEKPEDLNVNETFDNTNPFLIDKDDIQEPDERED